MILTGYKRDDRREYLLPLDVTIPDLNIPKKRITFVVDTGTTTTTICGPDANSLNLKPLSDRKPAYSIGYEGYVTFVKTLKDCTLFYKNDVEYSVTFDIDVTISDEPENKRTFMDSKSLLGMDFLEIFTISFKNNCVYLEKSDP
jgi:predicted aspartyl protease